LRLKDFDGRLHSGDDIPAVLPFEHHHARADDFTAPVARHRPLAKRRTGIDLAELADADRDPAVVGANDDVFDVFNGPKAPIPAKNNLLTARFDKSATSDAVVLGEGAAYLGSTDAMGGELCRIEGDPVLLHVSAKADDLNHTGHLP
jgi:hypothetical protein